MNYTQLNEKKKAQIDILLQEGLSMRKTAKIMNISHSTISRYKSNKYKRRKIDINKKYEIFIKYLYDHYDRRNKSIEVCVYKFNKSYKYDKKVTVQQVYNWVNKGKLEITREEICYKKRRKNGLSTLNCTN